MFNLTPVVAAKALSYLCHEISQASIKAKIIKGIATLNTLATISTSRSNSIYTLLRSVHKYVT
jgi:hypothetical protein